MSLLTNELKIPIITPLQRLHGPRVCTDGGMCVRTSPGAGVHNGAKQHASGEAQGKFHKSLFRKMSTKKAIAVNNMDL